MNKWRNNSQYFLFRYLHSISCTTNWPTWNLNAARWSKNYTMTHQHMMVVVAVGAGKFWGWGGIWPNCPKLARKYFKKWPLTKNSSFHFGRYLFQIKGCWATFLLMFSGSLLRCSWSLWRFSDILPRFWGILPGFSPNQNFWGCACTPCSPASYTTVSTYWNKKSFSLKNEEPSWNP